MLEERRALQASVAHDLRNPIAIMTGYVEYLQENSRGGTLTEEKLEKALSNLGITAERMGRYTDTMRDLGAMISRSAKRRALEIRFSRTRYNSSPSRTALPFGTWRSQEKRTWVAMWNICRRTAGAGP